MKNYDFKNRNPSTGPHLLGILLMVAGLFAWVSPFILEVGASLERVMAVGAGGIILGLLILNTYSGTTIDFTRKRYREYQSFAGFKSGEWKELPLIYRIEVKENTYRSRNTPNGISPTLSGKVTVFNICLLDEKKGVPFSFPYSNLQKAKSNARKLAKGFNVDFS